MSNGNLLTPHIVRRGETLSGIAHNHGLSAVLIWQHPRNAAIREQRSTPEMLAPGDVLYLPRSGACVRGDLHMGETNRVVATLPEVTLRIRLLDTEQRPHAGKSFRVLIAGAEPIEGTTTDSGDAVFAIPVLIRTVVVQVPSLGLSFPVHAGDLDPLDAPGGPSQRLSNLGFRRPTLAENVRDFQAKCGLPQTGVLDDATRSALESIHGV